MRERVSPPCVEGYIQTRKFSHDETASVRSGRGGENAHDAWDSKLVANLESELGSDCEIRYPRMPDEDDFGGTPQRVTG